MKHKTLLMLLVALVLMVGNAYGTESRMQALGSPFGYVRDNTDVFSFPGAINRYQNQVIGELWGYGTDVDWTLGAHLPVKDFVWGVYLNTPTGVNVDDLITRPGSNSSYATGTLNIEKKIQFYFGLLDSFGFGFGMAIDNSKMDVDNNPNRYHESRASYFDFSAGMSTDNMDVGLEIAVSGGSAENDIPATVDYQDSYFLLSTQASGRFYLLQDEDTDLMLVANLALQNSNTKVDVFNSGLNQIQEKTYKQGTFMLDIGAGVNYNIAEAHKVIFGMKPIRIALRTYENDDPVSASASYKNSYSYTYIPEYNLGLESKITSWLTGRLGARQNYLFYSRTLDPDGVDIDEDSYYNSGFFMDMGLGFEFGKFCIDAVLAKELLHDGPYSLGGWANGFATLVSVTYNH